MRNRLGALLSLILALTLVVGFDMASAGASAPKNEPDPGGVPELSHGEAVQALRAAQELLEHGRSRTGRSPRRPAGFTDGSLVLRDLWQARPTLRGADRRLADKLLAPPLDIGAAKKAARASSPCGTGQCYVQSKHFDVVFIHNPLNPDYATTSYAVTVAKTLEHVYVTEVGKLGFKRPLIAPGEPNGRIEIHLRDLLSNGLYGYCSATADSYVAHSPAFCVLDNDFKGYPSSPMKSLKVTAAHEFFHAIQYAYDTSEDSWLMEGSAVWMEDMVYNDINDYYQYVSVSPIRRPGNPLDFNGIYTVYGGFTFFKFLTRDLHAPNAVRQIWQAANAKHRGVYSLEAVKKVIRRHHRSIPTTFARFGAWNTLFRGSYPERSHYQPAGYWHTRTLTRHKGTGTLGIRLRHLANAPMRLLPAKHLGKRPRVRIKVNGPARIHGAAATVQVRYRNGHVRLLSFKLNKHGNGHHSYVFGTRVQSVVVVLTNGSTRMKGCNGNHAYSCGGSGFYDNKKFTVSARVV